MATFEERFEMTKKYVLDKDTTFPEAIAHGYLWYRYERALIRRRRAEVTGRKLMKKLNQNIDVFNFRKDLEKL
jgi:hypothetical protein